MNNKQSSLKAITDQGSLPLFFYKDAEVSLEIIRTLYRAGIRVLEYTNRGETAFENFKILINAVADEMPGLHLGIGTVKTAEEARQFIDAGAHFIVCPVVQEDIGRLSHEAGLLWIPGCMTPTEINIAHQMEAGLIKLFPANILGPEYVSSIKQLFPGQLFIPTGGVDMDQNNMREWFDSGVCAVGMGSKLISKTILETKDYNKLYTLTREMIELVRLSR